MVQKVLESQDECSKLKKKIESYTQFQWLVFIPVWMPGILRLVNHTLTTPGREVYVLLFNVGSLLFAVVAFAVIRLQIKKLKARLARLENLDGAEKGQFEPPLPGA